MVKNNQYRIVGCIIRAFRLSRGIDQAEYAKQIGTSQSWVSRIESGHRFMWLHQLDVVSRPFGVDNPAFCSFILECFREYGQKEISHSDLQLRVLDKVKAFIEANGLNG